MIRRNRHRLAAAGAALLASLSAALLLNCGCGRDVRLSGKKLREVQVKPVSHFGLTLDEKATPEQVVFATFEAIKADVSARTQAEREAALDIQFDLAAANEIVAGRRTALEPEELLYNVVHQWTPTVSNYVADFPATLDDAAKRLVQRSAGPNEIELGMVVKAPGTDPKAQAVLLVWLAKDKGLWRILHFGFDNKQRALARRIPAETTAPATPSADPK
jgi:hypothetical protein